MIARLRPWQTRALALLLLVVVLLALVAAIAIPVKARHQHYDTAIGDLVERLGRYQRVAAMRAGIQQELARVKARDSQKYYLKNSAAALAAAEMQQAAQAALDASGAQLNSMQIAPHKDEGEYRRVTINLQLRGTLAAVQRTLHALESAQPLLFVDNLVIRARAARGYVPAPGVEPEIQVQFDLTGYCLVEEKKA
jgi:general secretion pathway protein M